MIIFAPTFRELHWLHKVAQLFSRRTRKI